MIILDPDLDSTYQLISNPDPDPGGWKFRIIMDPDPDLQHWFLWCILLNFYPFFKKDIHVSANKREDPQLLLDLCKYQITPPTESGSGTQIKSLW